VDGLVGAFLAMLDERGLTGRTVVVMASDHGQELGDHGGYTYGHTLYDEVVRVPLIVAGPGVTAADQAVDTPVSLIDLAPTLAEMAGTALSGEAQGFSLVPALQGQAVDGRPVFSEALYRVPFNQQAIRSGGYKLIDHESDGQVELYDLQADPAESHDLAAERPGVADALQNDLQQWKSQMLELELTGLPHSASHDADAGKLW
jgi:arylsulfatase A-like enzyme